MTENLKKVFYALEDPLSCLFYARDLVRAAGKAQVNVLLPKHIDPSRFEFLLLKDAEYFSGVNIQGISSYPYNMLSSKGYFALPKRVDQIELSEHFNRLMPKSLVRPLLNAVLELKQAYFEPDGSIDLPVLREVFEEYQRFLQANDLNDDADYKRVFVDEALSPGSRLVSSEGIFIFAGFNEFTSYDLDIIDTVSKLASATFIVSPNILDMGTDYSVKLSERLVGMGFEIIKKDDERTTSPRVHEFSSINEEAYYVSQRAEQGTVYSAANMELYYSLLRYYLGKEKVSINKALRLDRTAYLRLFRSILLLSNSDWSFKDVATILNFVPLWEDPEKILLFSSKVHEGLTLPRGAKQWLKLMEGSGNNELVSFFKNISTKDISKSLNDIIKNSGIEKRLSVPERLELSSVMNLVSRVSECIEPKEMSAEVFVRKLCDHAEENYVTKGALSFKPLSVQLASLASSNISDEVFFVGMNQDSFVQNRREDVVMNDDLILKYRNEGFLYPTSRERSAIESKIIRDAASRAESSYLSSIGNVADFLNGSQKEEHKKLLIPVLDGAFSELDPKDIKIPEHKIERFSASTLKSYISCPYVFMATNLLEAEEEEAKEYSLKSKDAGVLLHDCLERLMPKELKGEKFNVEEEVQKVIAERFKDINEHPLKKVFIRSYATILKKFLDYEREYMNENRIEIFESPEHKFTTEITLGDENITLVGKIDRIDLNKEAKKLYVTDYKTSNIPDQKEIDSGEDVQIALYVMVLAKLYAGFECAGGNYVSIKKHERTGLDISSIEQAAERASINGVEAIKGMKKGLYTPAPIDATLCETCYYRRCCGAV